MCETQHLTSFAVMVDVTGTDVGSLPIICFAIRFIIGNGHHKLAI